MPQPVWSVVPISLTEACRDSSIPSYIGWMFLSESCTNSASQCSTACTVKRLSTLWNYANQSQVSHHGNIFDPPSNSSWSYRITSSAPMADRLSVWLVRRSGIPCPTMRYINQLFTYLPADLGSVSGCLCGIGGIGMTLSYNCFCAAQMPLYIEERVTMKGIIFNIETSYFTFLVVHSFAVIHHCICDLLCNWCC